MAIQQGPNTTSRKLGTLRRLIQSFNKFTEKKGNIRVPRKLPANRGVLNIFKGLRGLEDLGRGTKKEGSKLSGLSKRLAKPAAPPQAKLEQTGRKKKINWTCDLGKNEPVLPDKTRTREGSQI